MQRCKHLRMLKWWTCTFCMVQLTATEELQPVYMLNGIRTVPNHKLIPNHKPFGKPYRNLCEYGIFCNSRHDIGLTRTASTLMLEEETMSRIEENPGTSTRTMPVILQYLNLLCSAHCTGSIYIPTICNESSHYDLRIILYV